MGSRGSGRWGLARAIGVTVTVLLAVTHSDLVGWGPVDGLLDLAPGGELLRDVIEAVLWVVSRGLKKSGLLSSGIGRGCVPEA